MRLNRLGHATLLMESGSSRLLIDPGVYSTDWHALKQLDAVVITHEHHDHFDLDHLGGLIAANPGAAVMGPRSVCEQLERSGIEAVEISPGDTLGFDRLEVQVIGGVHALVHETIPRVANLGLVVSEPNGARVFHPGDSYEAVPGRIDVLALPLSSPWSTAGTAADFLNAVSPDVAFPIHDAGLSETGRATFMRIVDRVMRPGIALMDLESTGSIDI